MSLRFVATVVVALVTATANAQYPVEKIDRCEPLPPQDVLSSTDKLTAEDEWRFEVWTRDGYYAEIRQVSGGIILNWIGASPPWALAPLPDAFYAWENGYGRYCRHFSLGADKTSQTACRTDCVNWWNGMFYYVALKAAGGEWRTTAAEKLPQR
jgi:hypothetical protein